MTTSTNARPFRRRLLINTAAVGASNLWTMAVTFLALPVLLSGLGTEAFGIWVLLQTFSGVNGWFSLLDLGLGTAATREVAARDAVDDEDGLRTTVGTTLVAHSVLGLACAAAFAAIGPWVLPALFDVPASLDADLDLAIWAFAVQVPLDLTIRGYQAVLDGYQRVDRSRILEIARRTAVAAATAGAAVATGDLGTVAIASAVATGATALGGPLLLRLTAPGRPSQVHRSTFVELFRYARTVAVLRPIGVLHRTVDRFVVGVLLGPSAVAFVEVATQLQNGADSVMGAASYSLMPSAARLQAHERPDKLAELTQTGTRYVLLATWPVAALTAALAVPIVDVWVGADYAEAAGLAALAVASVLVVAPAQVAANLLVGTGRAGAILRVAVVGILINVALSIVLVEWFGIAGAFSATIASAVVTMPLTVAIALGDLALPPATFVRRAVLPAAPAALAAAAGAGAVALAGLGSWTTILLGGSIGAAAAALGAWRWGLVASERDGLRSRLARRGAA